MKVHFLSIAAFVLLFIAIPAMAQSNAIKAEVPFDFGVRGEQMPAGEYVVAQAVDDSGQRMVWQLTGGENSVVLLARSRQNPGAGDQISLIFEMYGDSYFLRGFIAPGSRIELPATKAEKDAQKPGGENLAKGGDRRSREEIVVVAAAVN